MADYLIKGETLSGIADAIRSKTGETESIAVEDMSGKIEGIEGGTDTSDATATADKIFAGETAYVAEGKVTGTFSLDSEISTQDNLISQIMTALEGKASGGGGASYEFSSVDFDNGGDWLSVHYATTLSNGEIILQVVDNSLGTGSGFEINSVIKGTNIWVDTADTYDWVCNGATLEDSRENTASGVVRWSFKITDSTATISD